jgi:hypothetical protein
VVLPRPPSDVWVLEFPADDDLLTRASLLLSALLAQPTNGTARLVKPDSRVSLQISGLIRSENDITLSSLNAAILG